MNNSEKTQSSGSAPSKSNLAEYTVTEISGALKRTVEDRFGMVRVRGEITGYRGPHSSGHSYFALKDDRARLEAVIWRGVASKLKHLPEEGLEVVATGKLTTYPGSSKYQIVIDNLEPAGAGALMALLEERRRKLTAEGLFAAERKQLLPYLPSVIGVVTSPTGAVIRDILHRLADRFAVHVIVWPVRVQGETCGAEVTNAVNGFNDIASGGPIPRPDLLIVARGGGSIEDLWGFNDESAVRAVAASDIPVISAVGHETDWTLLDLAADVRAPTPTGAAEMAVPVKSELIATLASLNDRLKKVIVRGIDVRRTTLRAAARGLPGPEGLLAMPQQRLDEYSGRLPRSLVAVLAKKQNRFQSVVGKGITSPKQAIEFSRLRFASAVTNFAQRYRTNVETKASIFNAMVSRKKTDLLLRSIANRNEQLRGVTTRYANAQLSQVREWRFRLTQASRLIETLSHTKVLQRGYAYVSDSSGTPVLRSKNIKPGAALNIHFSDGTIGVAASRSAVQTSPKPKKIGGDQGDLF